MICDKADFFEITPSFDDFIAALIPYIEEVSIKKQSTRKSTITIIGEMNKNAGTTITIMLKAPITNIHK
jgi:hypothetical protein